MKYLLCLMLLLSLSPVFSQNPDKEITNGFNMMNQAVVDGDYAKVADYMADELFSILPKDQFVGMMEMMVNNPQLEIKMSIPEILSIGAAIEVEGKFYVIVENRSKQEVRFFSANGEVAKLADTEMAQQSHATWKAQLGEENVSYDEESGFFSLKVTQKTLAISPDGKSSWKYLTVEENSLPMLKQIIPAEVMSKL